MLEMPHRNIWVVDDDDEQFIQAQLVTLDVQSGMHPDLPNPAKSEQKQP